MEKKMFYFLVLLICILLLYLIIISLLWNMKEPHKVVISEQLIAYRETEVDSVNIILDGGFDNDYVLFLVDKRIKKKGTVSTGFVTGTTGESFFVAKDEDLKININFVWTLDIKLNNKYLGIHIDMYNDTLYLTYTNRIFMYE